jgi:hypothetical protein
MMIMGDGKPITPRCYIYKGVKKPITMLHGWGKNGLIGYSIDFMWTPSPIPCAILHGQVK